MGQYDNQLGALQVGQIISTFLYGVGTLQTYIYFLKYSDGRELKLWVSVIWMIDTVNVILVCHGLYFLTRGQLSIPQNDEELATGRRSFDISTGFNILAAISVQCFFVKRIRQLCHGATKRWLPLAIMIVVVAHFGFATEAVIKVIDAFNNGTTANLPSLTFSAILPYTLAAVLADVFIAASLIILLRNRRTEFESTNSIINTIITFTVNRCVLITVAAIVRLTAFVTLPRTDWFIAADFVMGKLYANSLLATLNARRAPGDRDTTYSEGDSVVFSTVLNFAMPTPTNSNSNAPASSSADPVQLQERNGREKDYSPSPLARIEDIA